MPNNPQCPRCYGPSVLQDVTAAALIYGCADCLHVWEEDRPTLSRERVGSHMPCPRCGLINCRVSYQGRREEWECPDCHFGWELPATTEQSQ